MTTHHARPTIRTLWVVLSLAMPLPSIAQVPPSDLLNSRWTIDISKPDLGSANCQNRPSCLNGGDRIEIQTHDLNGNSFGSGWFIIYRNNSKLSAFHGLVRLPVANSPLGDHASFYFIDHEGEGRPAKRLRLSSLPDPSSQEACRQRLNELGRNQFTSDEIDRTCDEENSGPLVHWSICTFDPSGNCTDFDRSPIDDEVESLSPPDDGQGTGGGTD